MARNFSGGFIRIIYKSVYIWRGEVSIKFNNEILHNTGHKLKGDPSNFSKIDVFETLLTIKLSCCFEKSFISSTVYKDKSKDKK